MNNKVFRSRTIGVMRILVTLVGLFWAGALVSRADTYYVATNGTGNGTTWALATNNIQGAISLCSSGDVVLVSNGTYQAGGVKNWPSGTSLTNRVAITNAITVRSANNDPTNTIIKGRFDTGEPGAPGTVTNGSSAVRCVYMVNNSSLIGFTLTNGATFASTSGGAGSDKYAGGVRNESTNTIISNCVIIGNTADNRGGGAYYGTLYNCALTGNSVTNRGGGAYYSTLYDCTLTTNYSAYQGGGTYSGTATNCTYLWNQAAGLYGGGGAMGGTLYNCTVVSNGTYPLGYGGGASFLTMYNCTLRDNVAGQGGGVYGNSCKLYDCTLVGNRARVGGGASIGGGGFLYNCTLISNNVSQDGGGTYGSVILSNCTLIANSADNGGGAWGSTLYNCLLSGNRATSEDGGGAWGSTLYNCTLNYNYSAQYAGGAYTSVLNNCVLYFNTAASGGSNWYASDPDIYFTNCCTAPAQGGWEPGNITGDPMFITNGSGYGATYVAGNYRLQPNSPCINTGTNQDWMTNSVDLDGRMRIRYKIVDMGAYERLHSGTICSFH